MKKLSLILCAVAALIAPAMSAVAQTYPDKPVHVIIPLAAGSAVDNAARLIFQKMGSNMGASFVLDNQPGAAGLVGADKVAKAAPDGYTIGGFNDSVLTMIPHLYAKMPWDPLTDFEPVSLVATVEWGIIVKADSPYKTVKDLVAAAKAEPGKLTFSSGGNGSPQHIAMALLNTRTGANILHVPYRGATPAAVAVAAGEVDVSFQGLGTATSLIQAKKVRLLAVSTPTRMAQYPDTPTVIESGIKDFTFNSWFAMVAPAKTPKPVIKKLYDEMQKAMKDPETQKQMAVYGLTPRGSTPEELGSMTKTQFAMYKKLIQDNNIKPD
jgi:tripartite-type tricarboxylate transporter receptor subunit TctC